jgi:hypothetical protein
MQVVDALSLIYQHDMNHRTARGKGGHRRARLPFLYPSGQMVHLEFGQDRLTESQPLKTFELAQRGIEVAFKARLVAEQVIEL